MCFALWLLPLPWSPLSSPWDVSRVHLLLWITGISLWAFLSWPALPSLSFCGLFSTSKRGGGVVSDPLCHSWPLYFLCSLSFLLAEPHFQVFWSLQQLTASSPWPLICFPILHWFFNFILMPSELLLLAVCPLSFSYYSLVALLSSPAFTVQCCVEDEWRQASTSSLPENSSHDQIFRRWYFAAIFDFSVMFTEVVFCSCTLKKLEIISMANLPIQGSSKIVFSEKAQAKNIISLLDG